MPLSIVIPSNCGQPAFRRGAGLKCALEPGEIAHFRAMFRRFRPVARRRPSATAACVALPLGSMHSCCVLAVAAAGLTRVVARLSGKQAGLGWRPRRWSTSGGMASVFACQVGQYVLDHHRVFNASDDLDVAAAALAGLIGHIPVPARFAAVYDCANRLSCRFVNINVEHAFEALRLKLMATRRPAGVVFSVACDAPAVLPWPRLEGVTRARCALLGAQVDYLAAWKRVRLTRGLGTRATSLAMKSSGSTKSSGAILNSQRLARRAEGRMPGVISSDG